MSKETKIKALKKLENLKNNLVMTIFGGCKEDWDIIWERDYKHLGLNEEDSNKIWLKLFDDRCQNNSKWIIKGESNG